MEQYISIDIHVPKLLEWLISRRHCTYEWSSDIVKIRAKINSAIQDMPANDTIAKLLSGTYINYFHCLKIVEILRETEADSKNIFGRYSSKRMKDWQEIVSLYTKNNVYLAEAADLLINTVKFEIPSIKKQIAKLQQLQNELKKKETDAIKSGKTARNELAAFLKELGLEGREKGFKEGLIESAKQLYQMNDEVATEMKNILASMEHYISFTAITQPQQLVHMELLKFIAEKGNTTTYEWEKGDTPTKVVLPSLIVYEDDQELNDDGIDWGYSGIGATDNLQIELIDSGELKTEEKEPSETSADQKSENANEKVAEGKMALSILDNIHTRTNLVNQLLEIQCFLKTRIYEFDKEGMNEAIVESRIELDKMLIAVDKVLKLLTNTTSLHYFNILYSPRYLDDIIKKIEQKENAIERSGAIVEMAKERAEEALQEEIGLNKKAKTIVQKSRELQDQIAKDISQRYNGRKVNLMGGAVFS
ncbi:hypothetical protein O3M35_011889 [Rhynocoris fuscipes]|uniref:CDK5 regulatory subunit-associated protein 3 n=1 Tax=Rhynocoris fuscipes TaxID=488301 RepID=A0AAW1CZR7_9HEMI